MSIKRTLLSGLLLFTSHAFSQKAITNQVSADLRLGAGILNSKVFNTPTDYTSVSMPAVTLYYTPQITSFLEMQIGIGGDVRGGKTISPVAKYRSYNVNGIAGFRVRLKDFKVGMGVNPVYFLDTRKTVLEGSLSSGVVHIPVRHFKKTDLPVYFSTELKIHELFSLEARFSRSLDDLTDQSIPSFRTISLTANYLLAARYKRVRVSKEALEK